MKIGLVSTFNVECGISTYSEHLTEYYPIKDTVIFANRFGVLSDTKKNNLHPIIRCWNRTDSHELLTQKIIDSNIDVVHFQHEFGLFQNHESFCTMLKKLRERKIKIVITYHTVFCDKNRNNKIHEINGYANLVVLHSDRARNILNCPNSVVIEHGSVVVTPKPKQEARDYLQIENDRIVCLTFGFITPNKGAIDNISSVLRIKEMITNRIMLLIVGMPVVHGNNYSNLDYCLRMYKRVDAMKAFDTIKIIPKYIDEYEIDWYAGAADIAIENYYQTEYSISGMSHLVMSYGLPSISSNSNILIDLNDSRSLKYDIGNIDQMTNQLKRLVLDHDLRKQLSKNSLDFAKTTCWESIAKRTLDKYQQIL